MTNKVKETLVSWALAKKYPEESIAELVTRLNAVKEIENPEPAKLLPEPVSMETIRNTVPDLEAFKVLNTAIWPLIANALERGDMPSVMSNIKALIAGQCLTEKTALALGKLFVGKIPDPNYCATVLSTEVKLAGWDNLTELEINNYLETLVPVVIDEPTQEEVAK